MKIIAIGRAASATFIAAAVAGLALNGPAFAKKKKNDEAPVETPASVVRDAPEDAWRSIDPANVLLMDLPAGEIVIELRPDFAPGHVERIKTLTREGFYDGLTFHRVIEGFVAQGGDPEGDGTGGSELPDLQPEFARDASAVEDFTPIGRDRIAARVGFADGMPTVAQPESLRAFRADEKVDVWAAHCPGVMSMARATNPASANSQFFLMIGDARENLDKRYTAWGLIVDGFEHSRRISRGEPPDRPTPIIRMRIAEDVPADERPNVEIMRTDHPSFARFVELAKYARDGLVKDLCNVKAPRRVNGKIEL